MDKEIKKAKIRKFFMVFIPVVLIFMEIATQNKLNNVTVLFFAMNSTVLNLQCVYQTYNLTRKKRTNL